MALAFPAGAIGTPIEPYGKHDSGGFRNVLPPAQGTDANLTQILQFEATGKMPPHTQDQLAMYANLVNAAPGLKRSQISKYYKDATFGVRPGDGPHQVGGGAGAVNPQFRNFCPRGAVKVI